MPRALEHREAEAPIQLLASDRAHKLCFVAWLEVALCCDICCADSILIPGEPVARIYYYDQMQISKLHGRTMKSASLQDRCCLSSLLSSMCASKTRLLMLCVAVELECIAKHDGAQAGKAVKV